MFHLPFLGARKGQGLKPGEEDEINPDQETISSLILKDYRKVFTSADPWKAQYSQTFVCISDEDNTPIESIVTTRDKKQEFTCVISQNRGGHKDMGQDSMAIAKHRDWEVVMLADGHDDLGHLVSQGVCSMLPNVLLKKIDDRFPDELNDPVTDEIMYNTFDDCEYHVCWMKGTAAQGDLVQISDGDYAGVCGHVTGFDENLQAIVTVYEEYEIEAAEGSDEPPEVEVGYLEIEVAPHDLLLPRFNGGGTCLAMVRNVVTNECRAAVAGDSRMLIYLPLPPNKSQEPGAEFSIRDDCLEPVYGTRISKKTGKPYLAFLTPQHNIHNKAELSRLEQDYNGMFEIKGDFLVNPETNFMIQPTRGFGDHDMHGTGYTHIPQLTDTFSLPTGALVILASDGVFDDNVWLEREIVDRIGELFEDESKSANEIAKTLYAETLDRSEKSGYVDDISIITFTCPEPVTALEKKLTMNSTVKAGSVSATVADEEEVMSVRRSIDLARQTSTRSMVMKNARMRDKSEVSHSHIVPEDTFKGSPRKITGKAKNKKGKKKDNKTKAKGKKDQKKTSDVENRRKTLQRGTTNIPAVIETILGAGDSFERLEATRDPSKASNNNNNSAEEKRFEPKPPSLGKGKADPIDVKKGSLATLVKGNKQVDPVKEKETGKRGKKKKGKKQKEVKAKVKKGGKTFFKKVKGRKSEKPREIKDFMGDQPDI